MLGYVILPCPMISHLTFSQVMLCCAVVYYTMPCYLKISSPMLGHLMLCQVMLCCLVSGYVMLGRLRVCEALCYFLLQGNLMYEASSESLHPTSCGTGTWCMKFLLGFECYSSHFLWQGNLMYEASSWYWVVFILSPVTRGLDVRSFFLELSLTHPFSSD